MNSFRPLSITILESKHVWVHLSEQKHSKQSPFLIIHGCNSIPLMIYHIKRDDSPIDMHSIQNITY